jgi:hypothetical protein
MNTRFLAVGALAIFTAHVANATILLDTVHVTNPQSGWDGAYDSTAAMAVSFTAATQNFTGVSLLLAATNPLDGGSATVFLVPDNGGGSSHVAGIPTAAFPGGVFSSFSGATSLGSIADSSLATAGSGSTLAFFSVHTTITSPNSEYWIGLVPNASSSADWYFGGTNNGIGVAGQSSFFASTAGGGGGSSTILDSSSPPYDLIVATPEPASIAILGVGLLGIGYFRQRNAHRT